MPGEVEWATFGGLILKLIIAYVLALPIAWDRERAARGAGLRTFPLVALGACAYALVGREAFQDQEAQSRVIYGIITGIGFIGGGAIIKEKGEHAAVTGTATAAAVWNTGAIGVAVSWSRYDVALLLSVINFVTLTLGRQAKKRISTNHREVPPTEHQQE